VSRVAAAPYCYLWERAGVPARPFLLVAGDSTFFFTCSVPNNPE
jgi:hypothetical protein